MSSARRKRIANWHTPAARGRRSARRKETQRSMAAIRAERDTERRPVAERAENGGI